MATYMPQPRRCLKEAPNVGREDAQDAATTDGGGVHGTRSFLLLGVTCEGQGEAGLVSTLGRINASHGSTTSGILNAQRHGVRIPLPPLSRPLVSLPANCPELLLGTDFHFDWLQVCHPHPRDTHIRFVSEGHKYFVDNEPFDLSVTSFVCTFSEDCVGYCLRVCWFKMIDVVNILECNTAMR